MAYIDKIINWSEFITFTKGGLVVADYSKIRIALQNAFKSIYGDDIDLSTGTADGVYIEVYGLIINNILQSFKTFYNNLNIENASGKFLDYLCALSNVSRKGASASTAKLLIKLDPSYPQDSVIWDTSTSGELAFIDQNGRMWSMGSGSVTIEKDVSTEIVVTCSELGPVNAVPGFINQLVSNEISLIIEQPNYANVGSWGETDSSLRARRNQSLGSTGNTVLESLIGELEGYSGVRDALIYNGEQATKAKDETNVGQHNVYIILRYDMNIRTLDENVGKTIFNKMTAGIPTVDPTGDQGPYVKDNEYGVHRWIFRQDGINGSGGSEDNDEIGDYDIAVYWRVAKPIAPSIVITITPYNWYGSGAVVGSSNTGTDKTAEKIANNVIDSLNNYLIGKDININTLHNLVVNSDPLFRGQATYEVASITVDSKNTNYVNPDTYFQYVKYDVKDNGSTITITITGEE